MTGLIKLTRVETGLRDRSIWVSADQIVSINPGRDRTVVMTTNANQRIEVVEEALEIVSMLESFGAVS